MRNDLKSVESFGRLVKSSSLKYFNPFNGLVFHNEMTQIECRMRVSGARRHDVTVHWSSIFERYRHLSNRTKRISNSIVCAHCASTKQYARLVHRAKVIAAIVASTMASKCTWNILFPTVKYCPL